MAKILFVDDNQNNVSYKLTYWLSMCGTFLEFRQEYDIEPNIWMSNMAILRVLSTHLKDLCCNRNIHYQKYKIACDNTMNMNAAKTSRKVNF